MGVGNSPLAIAASVAVADRGFEPNRRNVAPIASVTPGMGSTVPAS
jgi:hypothetical protein